jgi:hypothetical protein
VEVALAGLVVMTEQAGLVHQLVELDLLHLHLLVVVTVVATLLLE